MRGCGYCYLYAYLLWKTDLNQMLITGVQYKVVKTTTTRQFYKFIYKYEILENVRQSVRFP